MSLKEGKELFFPLFLKNLFTLNGHHEHILFNKNWSEVFQNLNVLFFFFNSLG